MAGYSNTPLSKKLGIKAGHRVVLLAAPTTLAEALEPLPDNVQCLSSLRGSQPLDVVVWFTKRRAELEKRFGAIADRLEPAGGLWVAWPKQASKVATDITEGVVRQIALAEGLVDNKVCAIDEVWSGLRCVIRKENRPR